MLRIKGLDKNVALLRKQTKSSQVASPKILNVTKPPALIIGTMGAPGMQMIHFEAIDKLSPNHDN